LDILMRNVVAIAVLALLAGCAYRPVVDPKTSKNPERFDADLAECRQIAEGNTSGGGAALAGAGIGAAIGAGVAAASGNRDAVGGAAGAGAVIGGAKGAGGSAREKRTIVRNCLKGRGHAVLN
jgi:hypothetical protein